MSSSACMSEVHIRLQDESNLQTSQSQVASSSSLPSSNVDGSDHSSVIQCQDGSEGSTEASVSSVTSTSQSSNSIEGTTVPFVPSKLYGAAKWALDTADFYGEKLAYFFGITSPKYSYEINRYNRMMKEEAARKAAETEFSGWNNNSHTPINGSTAVKAPTGTSSSIQVYDSLSSYHGPKF